MSPGPWLSSSAITVITTPAESLRFAACTTAFVTQTLIGGARLIYMPLYIYQQAAGANNWPFAAAMSVLLLVSVLLVVYLLNLAGRSGWAVRHG